MQSIYQVIRLLLFLFLTLSVQRLKGRYSAVVEYILLEVLLSNPPLRIKATKRLPRNPLHQKNPKGVGALGTRF
jgi:hypothetical protein